MPTKKRGEDIECEALVDSGAAELSLPAELIERLKLEETGASTTNYKSLVKSQLG